jgi:hypothetical protein
MKHFSTENYFSQNNRTFLRIPRILLLLIEDPLKEFFNSLQTEVSHNI